MPLIRFIAVIFDVDAAAFRDDFDALFSCLFLL